MKLNRLHKYSNKKKRRKAKLVDQDFHYDTKEVFEHVTDPADATKKDISTQNQIEAIHLSAQASIDLVKSFNRKTTEDVQQDAR